MVYASIKYGMSYVWTEYEPFKSIADVKREVADPGSITDHLSSYFPCSRDWEVIGSDREAVAFIHRGDGDYDPCTHMITVGHRGGLKVERY